MQLLRQMQQKCVPECTSFVIKMAVEVEGSVECSIASFMEELQRYESLYNKFLKDYKNKQVRDNCWLALGKKFYMTAEEAEKKYKSIRSSYGRWLRKAKKVPSGSERDAVPFAGDYANLQWLEQHIGQRTHSSCFNSCTRVLYSPSCSLL